MADSHGTSTARLLQRLLDAKACRLDSEIEQAIVSSRSEIENSRTPARRARTNIDRVITAVPPIAAFAAAGFEHCIANVYFIPMGMFIKAGAPDSFWKAINKTAANFPDLTWGNFFANLVPVTLGNIIGGSLMVAAVYWFVYLRKTPVDD